MKKLLNSVLDKISESNNDYRKKLENINSAIDDRTTNFISEIITESNYMIDFSSTISEAKEKLVTPINSEVESYVIKDLRGVESVNEQFFEKINDKIDSTKVENEEEEKSFVDSLDSLLNDKYLEIVKIKRKPFLNDAEKNIEIENIVDGFVEDILKDASVDVSTIKENYKKDIYKIITDGLQKISDLYQDNFINEISSSLNDGANDYVAVEEPVIKEEKEKPKRTLEVVTPSSLGVEVPTPFEAETPSPVEEEVPTSLEPNESFLELDETKMAPDEEETIIKAEQDVLNINKPLVLIDEDRLPKLEEFVPPVLPSFKKRSERKLDVATDSLVNDGNYKELEPISYETEEYTSSDAEKNVVNEMIKRLTNRLELINKREAACDEEEAQIKEDEDFVNDLIESANRKKEELDNFEKELDSKEKELEEKQTELDNKINKIMPFADAVLKSEKES